MAINGRFCMEEKLCPFDKAPCIKQKCAIFIEEQDCCALVLPLIKEKIKLRDYSEKRSDSSKFKAHLFD
jgi:hypothetical protein